ncbi:MAG: hypothetical protein PVF05_10865 [Gemmatimonadales bacterium]|jgi:hypothetical protein
MEDSSAERTGLGSLAAWLLERELLRGPLPFTDYWASVLRLEGGERPEREAAGLVDRPLFRLGVDRPELELPRLRYYLLLFFVGPLLVALRSFRRIGRYRIRMRSGTGERVLELLREYRLELRPGSDGGVDVHRPHAAGARIIARGLADPFAISGFTSLFLAAYKLPLAALAGIVFAGLAIPLLHGWEGFATYGIQPILLGFPLLVLLLLALFREVGTAVLGAVPVLIAAVIYWSLGFETSRDWSVFALALAALFLVYLLIDLFFFPRPVPPTLMLYTKTGDGTPYGRREDAPWWLEGEAYWVWRYLMLTPAEINKFWERDWERVDLWIRADGPGAGILEWVVTDGHYRELWTPLERLAPAERLEVMRTEARRAHETGAAGTWLMEVDANLLFHTPDLRAVSFLPDEGRVPARRIGHVLRSMWTRFHDPAAADALRRLERIELERGPGLLDDLPELIAHRAARHILSLPWTHWRYPLGANRRREERVYEDRPSPTARPAADPALQIKLESEDGAAASYREETFDVP